MTRAITLCLLWALFTTSSCKKDAPAAPGAAAQPAAAPQVSSFHKAPLAKLKGSGLAVGEFEATAAKPYGAAACVRGEVSKLDVLLCNYPTAEAARAAEAKLGQFVSSAVTGIVRSAKTIALAAADRNKVDLAGKQINKIAKAFSE